MTLAPASRFVLICTVIFAMLSANVSVAKSSETEKNSRNDTRIGESIGLTTLTILSVVSLGRWLTPLDEWHAEIRKLTADEHFVERWMLLNDDPVSLEKGNRALSKIREERKAMEKKYNRFNWLYVTAMGVIGGVTTILIFSLRGD